jgi:hypothetical protein
LTRIRLNENMLSGYFYVVLPGRAADISSLP